MRIQTKKDYLDSQIDLSLAYTATLGGDTQAAQTVLKDLAKFCKAYETTFHKDERVTLMLEGRREVWLRFMEYLKLTPDEIYKLHVVKEMVRTTNVRKEELDAQS